MNIPNLFTYATSELSQDAFLCWLMSWSDDSLSDIDEQIHVCARKFIQLAFNKASLEVPQEIRNVTVRKQDSNIDVLCVINEEYAIIIEDKVETKQHSGQLSRYLTEVLAKGFPMGNIIPLYYKTGDQSNYDQVISSGYYPIERHEIIDVLNSYTGLNNILCDYRDFLSYKDSLVSAFIDKPASEWDYHCWIGFFKLLKNRLADGDWDFVNNANGGFTGFWWHFSYGDDCDRYIQLEEGRLCFKIAVDDTVDKRSVRNKWHDVIMSSANGIAEKLRVRKPERFGNGSYMTVCVASGDYRVLKEDNTVNFEETIKLLREAERILDRAINIV